MVGNVAVADTVDGKVDPTNAEGDPEMGQSGDEFDATVQPIMAQIRDEVKRCVNAAKVHPKQSNKDEIIEAVFKQQRQNKFHQNREAKKVNKKECIFFIEIIPCLSSTES